MVEGLALDKGSSGHSPNPNSGVSASLTLPASPEAAHRLKATTRQSQRERGRLRRRERNSSIFSLGGGGGVTGDPPHHKYAPKARSSLSQFISIENLDLLTGSPFPNPLAPPITPEPRYNLRCGE